MKSGNWVSLVYVCAFSKVFFQLLSCFKIIRTDVQIKYAFGFF